MGTNPGEFTIDDVGGVPPAVATLVLMPGESQSIAVSFTPTSAGLQTAMVHIRSNDPEEGIVDVTLTGAGVDSPPPGVRLEQPGHIGGSTSSATVSTATDATAPNGHLYLASIAARSNKSVWD